MRAMLETTLWNPVLRRELLTGLRSPRLRWILLLYLVVPFVVIAWVWPTGRMYYGGGWEAERVWWQFLNGQFLLVCLVTPVFAAYSVSNEFEQGTADLLWTSLVSPKWIVLSKMLAVMLLSAALLVASLPALSLIFFLGGVGVQEMLNGFRLLLAATACVTAVSVYESAAARKGHAALFYSYLLIFLVGALVFILAGMIFWMRRPFGALGPFTVALCLMSAYFVKRIWRIADQPLAEEVSGKELAAKYGPAQPRRRRRNPYVHWRPFPDGANAVGLQELRMHPLYPYRHAVLAVIVVPFLLVLLTSGIEDGPARLHSSFWATNLFLAALWVALCHGVSITMEQEQGVLNDLRVTAVGPKEFLNGKWRASWRARWLWVLGGAGVLGYVNLIEEPYPGAWLAAPLLWIAAIELTGSMAFAASSVCHKTMMALAVSVAVALMVWTGSLALPEVVDEFTSWRWRWEHSLRGRLAAVGILAASSALCYWLALRGVRYQWNRER